MGEALWQTRLRWRLRGAMLWPAFVVAVVVEAILLDLLPVSGDGGPGPVRRRAARRLPEPLPRGRRRAAGRALAAPPPARDARGDRHRPGGRRAARRRVRARRASWASLHHSSVRAAHARPQRPGGLGAALRHQPGAARVPGQRRPPRHRQAGRRPLPHVRRRPDPDRAFCVFVNTDQSPPGRHPRPRPAAQRGGARSVRSGVPALRRCAQRSTVRSKWSPALPPACGRGAALTASRGRTRGGAAAAVVLRRMLRCAPPRAAQCSYAPPPAGPRGGASHSRLSRVADPYPSRMGEALWQTRLRWRLRGAMLWPAFVGRRRGRGRPARPAARLGRRRARALRRGAARRLPQPLSSSPSPRRWPGAGCAAAGPGCRR